MSATDGGSRDGGVSKSGYPRTNTFFLRFWVFPGAVQAWKRVARQKKVAKGRFPGKEALICYSSVSLCPEAKMSHILTERVTCAWGVTVWVTQLSHFWVTSIWRQSVTFEWLLGFLFLLLEGLGGSKGSQGQLVVLHAAPFIFLIPRRRRGVVQSLEDCELKIPGNRFFVSCCYWGPAGPPGSTRESRGTIAEPRRLQEISCRTNSTRIFFIFFCRASSLRRLGRLWRQRANGMFWNTLQNLSWI